MKHARLITCLSVALTMTFTAASIDVLHAQNDTAATASEAEGLVKVKVPGLQQVYARPDADLSRYRDVLLDPIEVSFRRNWDRQSIAGTRIQPEESQKIREGLARILREELAHELANSGRYRLVEQPGEDVLRVQAEIRNLQINAPDVIRPGIVRTYTLSAGEMTLVAELRDSVTGELIARVIDRYRDPETPWFELTTRVDNIAAARQAASRWASILREQLDVARQGEKVKE